MHSPGGSHASRGGGGAFLAKGSRVVDGLVMFLDEYARNQLLCTGLPAIWLIPSVDRLLKLFRVRNRQMMHFALIWGTDMLCGQPILNNLQMAGGGGPNYR